MENNVKYTLDDFIVADSIAAYNCDCLTLTKTALILMSTINQTSANEKHLT